MSLDNIARIEDKIDKVAAGATPISMSLGGVQFDSMVQLLEFAKLMSISGAAVPPHLRGNPGTCLAVCTKALRFGFDPFSLAEHSYSMKRSVKNGTQWEDVETIAYDSFVIHAIIEAHAQLTGRLRVNYEGEGDARKCTVSGVPKGEAEPLSLTSPTLGELKAARGRNDKGVLRGSPLWETKPDQQLAYDTRRDFCRRYFPEILLGWYDKDEFDEYSRSNVAQDVTPKPDLASRLTGSKGKRGFSKAGVDQALIEHKPGQTLDTAPAKEKEPVEVRSDATAGGDGAAPKEEAVEPVDELSEWLDEQIAIANNLKASEELDELDPRVWKRLRDAGRAKDLGEKWETEGFNPNMNRLDPARKAKK